MDITEQTRIAAPLDQVWPLLRDPRAVVACIPGAQLAPDSGDGVWRGSIRVKFGPTAAVFRGEATLEFDDAAHRCTIEGRGIDQRGASRALSNGTIEATADGDATLLTVQGGFAVTGPLETFANAGGVHVARALLAEFATNMAGLVAERRPAAPAPGAADPTGAMRAEPGPAVAAGAAAPAPGPALAAGAARPEQAPAGSASASGAPRSAASARELSGLGLLWRAFLSWLRSLFARKA